MFYKLNILISIFSNVSPIYQKVLMNELERIYLFKKSNIKKELKEQIESHGSFSLTLDAWTAINQDAYLGIIM